MITIEDFKKLQIVIAQIKEVKEHPNADKLYLVYVDIAGEQRQLVAGIRPFYTKKELIGRQVAVVSNLAPAVIRGEESQGMILAASDETTISVLSPDKEVKLGSPVR
ncbi:MAG: hypothetical protein ABIJ41_08285 [Candidatus Omnitrophota bacterium]